jgi:hypothetical protein
VIRDEISSKDLLLFIPVVKSEQKKREVDETRAIVVPHFSRRRSTISVPQFLLGCRMKQLNTAKGPKIMSSICSHPYIYIEPTHFLTTYNLSKSEPQSFFPEFILSNNLQPSIRIPTSYHINRMMSSSPQDVVLVVYPDGIEQKVERRIISLRLAVSPF